MGKKEFGKIIAPVDGSKAAKKAAKKAISLAKNMGIDVVAMYVVQIHTPLSTPLANGHVLMEIYKAQKKKEQSKGQSVLSKIKEIGTKMGVNVSKKIVDGHPAEEIIKEAKKNDLIVIGSKGTTALDRLLMGSVAENVVHHAPCPVMVVK